MKISGTRGYIDIEHNRKKERFWGDLCYDGFAATASSMERVAKDSEYLRETSEYEK